MKRKYRVIADNEQGFKVQFKREGLFTSWVEASTYFQGSGWNSFATLELAKAHASEHSRRPEVGTVVADLGYLPA